MMNTGLSQGSAKIYQFPTGGRAAWSEVPPGRTGGTTWN